VVVLPPGSGGVTDLKFSVDGVRLFSSSRKASTVSESLLSVSVENPEYISIF
jgi:hypothetical protein